MKPKNKRQRHILALSKKLHEATSREIDWSYRNCLLHLAYRNKSGVACLDCGHAWSGPRTGKRCECPNCFTTLSIRDTRKKKFEQTVYMAMVDIIEGHQVVRTFEIKGNHKVGTVAKKSFWEISQQWITPQGEGEVVARVENMFTGGNFTGNMEIRRPNTVNNYNLYPAKVYPGAKVLPIFKRNGYKTSFYGLPPYSLLSALLNPASKVETLLKAGQVSLVRCGDGGKIQRCWNSIKILIRNNYIVKDGSLWFDYVSLLAHYKKDLRNPVFVCPANLKQEHDRLVRKRQREIDERNREYARLAAEQRVAALKRQMERMAIAEQEYLEQKKPFLGLVFKDGDIEIKVLKNVQEFIEEAEAHKHCVFTNSYYEKPESLVLSARVNGKPIETVEVSLTKFTVIQSRGKGNEASKFNKQIIELVSKNMGVIRQRCQKMEVAI